MFIGFGMLKFFLPLRASIFASMYVCVYICVFVCVYIKFSLWYDSLKNLTLCLVRGITRDMIGRSCLYTCLVGSELGPMFGKFKR